MKDEVNEIVIEWKDLFKAIDGLKTNVRNKIVVKREVVPIIFVPGIMGSRLKNGSGTKVWDPDDAGYMAWTLGVLNADPRKRKAILVGKRFQASHLEVSDDDAEHNKKFAGYQGAADRGWGGVAWMSYGAILQALQTHVWSEPVRHCFEFPVHAQGYNWTASNDLAGQNLKAYIDEVIRTYAKPDRPCEKVILVTHSMGGLVARSACMLHGAASKVLGVIHGVQPVTGSAAAYWRMKAGFDRPEGGPTSSFTDWLRNPLSMAKRKVAGTAAAWVLGKDGAQVTALLGNMPGGLQLLPNKLYTDNAGSAQWLGYPDLDGTSQVKLPGGDPYADIYRAQDYFYRLIDPAFLDPGGKTSRFNLGPWENYLTYLGESEEFHDKLADQVHPETFQFYSRGIKSADRIDYTRDVRSWTTDAKRILKNIGKSLPTKPVTMGGSALLKVAFGAAAFTPAGLAITAATTVGMAAFKETDLYIKHGGFRTHVDESDKVIPKGDDKERAITFDLTLLPPGGSGDGTVPVSSGRALDAKVGGVKSSEPIGDLDESWFVRDHEPIYKTRTAQHMVFATVENLCLARIKEKAG